MQSPTAVILRWDPAQIRTEHRENDSRDQGQAHVPAEQPSPREDSWVPVAHADPRRARHHGRAAPQGSQRIVGLSIPPLAKLPSVAACCRPPDPSRRLRDGGEAGPPGGLRLRRRACGALPRCRCAGAGGVRGWSDGGWCRGPASRAAQAAPSDAMPVGCTARWCTGGGASTAAIGRLEQRDAG